MLDVAHPPPLGYIYDTVMAEPGNHLSVLAASNIFNYAA